MKITLKDIYNLFAGDVFVRLVDDEKKPWRSESSLIPDDCLEDYMDCEVIYIETDGDDEDWHFSRIYVKL